MKKFSRSQCVRLRVSSWKFQVPSEDDEDPPSRGRYGGQAARIGIKENDGGIWRNNPKQSGLVLRNKGLGGETFRETG